MKQPDAAGRSERNPLVVCHGCLARKLESCSGGSPSEGLKAYPIHSFFPDALVVQCLIPFVGDVLHPVMYIRIYCTYCIRIYIYIFFFFLVILFYWMVTGKA